MSPEERQAIDAFRKDVLEASLNNLILVRFTADWCGPCKQLAPILDKAIAEVGQGRTREVVVDIDRNPVLASQFRIQSVPTIYAFLGGQPVDGFNGVRSEREVKAFIEKLLTALPPTEEEASIDLLVTEANRILAEGDPAQAAQAFAAILQEAPDDQGAIAGYARALIALGQLDGAEAALAAAPADSKEQPIIQARSALELARKAAPAGELEALQARVAADPADHEARIALSNALFAAGDRDDAADLLLESIRLDREWNEGAARAQLLKFIDAVGFSDPWSVGMRRRLSAVLFT